MSCQGIMDDKKIAVNFGGGFQTENGKATEDSIFIKGKIYKQKNLEYIYDYNNP